MNSWTPEQATRELLTVLPLINQIVVSEVRREVGEAATMAQFRVLSHIAECPLTLTELARKRRVSAQSIGELVQVLVERGWVERRPLPHDRRQHVLFLTAEGTERYLHAQWLTEQHLAPLLAELNEAEMAAIQTALPALRRVLARETIREANGN